MTITNNESAGRIFYASPWLLAAASLLLTLIIGVFAVNNFQREKKLMNLALVQEGQAVLNLVSSSSKAAIRNEFMRGNHDITEWLDAVAEVIENSAEHQGLSSLTLVSERGTVLVTSFQPQLQTTLDESSLIFLKNLEQKDPRQNYRVISYQDKRETVFQIAAKFRPFRFKNDMPPPMREMMRGRMNRSGRDRGDSPGISAPPSDDWLNRDYYLIAELDMSEFRQSIHRQFIQIIVLSVVLLMVGIGTLLSLIMLRGFKGSQLRLQRMTEFTDVLISSMPVGIIALDDTGVIRTCNPSSCDLLNLKTDEIVGRQGAQVLPEPLFKTIVGKKIEDRSDGRSELQITVDDKKINLQVLRVDIEEVTPSYKGIMLLIQDLTTQKKLEHELRRNERHTALGKMAAGVAHELRNPLSSVKGLAILLKSRQKTASTGKEAADLLISEVDRLDRSIGELLNYSRHDVLDLHQVNVKELIKRSLALLLSDANAAHVIIQEVYDSNDLFVEGDADKLTQVFLNIFLNSLQAMPDGGSLAIGVNKDQNDIRIIVQDNGTGIASGNIEKIFDPYFTTKNDGTGLGLSLSAKIIEDHYGKIKIESLVGQGTTVTIVLPVQS